MSSVNKVILLGRLGAEPELRYTPNQVPVCTLKIATNDRRKGQDGQWTEHTEWHTIVTFGKTAENCNQYLQKGRQVFIEGRIQTRKYQDQEGKDRYWTEVIANTVQFIGGRGSEGLEVERVSTPAQNQNAGAMQNEAGFTPAMGAPVSFDDDDIPF
ncbi:MAG TPA: single-stranded DNA-binding protein [Oligoflexia bacterium]|nr:single-stranded DNA-binding protein [Oligoflexia bacterium]